MPVVVSAVLGASHMPIGDLLRLGPGTVLELDRKVGEAIDIFVNNRLVARARWCWWKTARRHHDRDRQGRPLRA